MGTSSLDAKKAELAAQQERINSLSDAVRIEFNRRMQGCSLSISRTIQRNRFTEECSSDDDGRLQNTKVHWNWFVLDRVCLERIFFRNL